MELSLEELQNLLTPERIESGIRAAILLVVFLPMALYASAWANRRVAKKYTAQRGLVVGKIIRYSGIAIVFLLVFRELGFSIAPLLGAAGIAGVALAFASQTSVSNIISGLFLIAENPFSVGDVITVGETTGIVISIDTLSVKLRTFDNRFVRLPNEMLIKSELINVTKFPIRRVDVELGVSYDADLEKVRATLLSVAEKNPMCLVEPSPLIILNGFGDSSINFMLGVWAVREEYLKLMNSIQEEIKAAFDEAGIEIPFPQRVVHAPRDPDPPENPEPVTAPEGGLS